MDREEITSLRDVLINIRRVCIGAFPGDKHQNAILSLISIPHPDSAIIQNSDPEELADFYAGQIHDIHEYCLHAEASQLRSYVLGVVTQVENWAERGIIVDMGPAQTQPNKPEKLVAEPEKTDGHELREWRIETFRDLAFTELEAGKLADAKDITILKDKAGMERRYEAPLHHSKAKRMLEQGCNHRQVVNLLAE